MLMRKEINNFLDGRKDKEHKANKKYFQKQFVHIKKAFPKNEIG